MIYYSSKVKVGFRTATQQF